jgi:hypothetical protein
MASELASNPLCDTRPRPSVGEVVDVKVSGEWYGAPGKITAINAKGNFDIIIRTNKNAKDDQCMLLKDKELDEIRPTDKKFVEYEEPDRCCTCRGDCCCTCNFLCFTCIHGKKK